MKTAIDKYKEKQGGDELVPNDDISAPTESAYTDKNRRIKDMLDSVGPGMCVAKWYNVSMHLTHGWTHSCYHPPAHKIPVDELKKNPTALHNTKYKKQVREIMLKGGRPKECSYCWKVEDAPGNHLSDRVYRSSDVFTYNGLEKAVSENPLVTNFNPRYVEVNFNHACNLKCSYCSPHLSSTWMEEVEDFGSYEIVGGWHNDIRWMLQEDKAPIRGTMQNPYLEAFWKWWPDMYKDLRTFRMTGGEPLIDRNTYKVLEYVKDNPKPNLELSVTTNGVPDPGDDNVLFRKFTQQVKEITDSCNLEHFMLFISLDSVGEKAEYIRNGLDFEKLKKNIEYFMSEVTDRHSITFINTFNALSVTSHREFLEWILDLRKKYSIERQLIWFDTPYLHDPKWQSIKNLTPEFDKYLEDDIQFMKDNRETRETRFHGFKDYEVDRLERNLEWGREKFEPQQSMLQKVNFYKFFREHDRRRGTDFCKVFPEMADFYNHCKDEEIRFNTQRKDRLEKIKKYNMEK